MPTLLPEGVSRLSPFRARAAENSEAPAQKREMRPLRELATLFRAASPRSHQINENLPQFDALSLKRFLRTDLRCILMLQLIVCNFTLLPITSLFINCKLLIQDLHSAFCKTRSSIPKLCGACNTRVYSFSISIKNFPLKLGSSC